MGAMNWLTQLGRRLLMLLRRRQFESELEEEMRLHRELREQDQIERGLSPEEARFAAQRRFGNDLLLREESRDTWGWNWFEHLVRDIRYGIRVLVRNPGFTAVAVITLALGIGSNTTVFSVINATLLRPLPFPHPDRLVLVWETSGKGHDNWNAVSAPNFWDLERQSKSFEGIAIFDAGRGYNLSPMGTKQEAEQVSGLRVSARFFSVLGVEPFLGRTFLPEEETLGKNHEVILSYGLWERRYGGDSSLVGRTITIDGQDFTVVGVMPRQFRCQFWNPSRLWVPVGYTKSDYDRGENDYIAIGRLKPGVTVPQAQSEMEGIANRLAQEYPTEDVGMGAWVVRLGEFGREDLRTALLALLVAVGFVLLIACVNVANLLLAPGAARQKELAIRSALGAGRVRIARQMLTESALLALLGGAAGLLLATWSSHVLFHVFRLDNLHLPGQELDSIPMDNRVFAFVLLVSCLTGVLFGLAPLFGALRRDVNEPLKGGGRESTRGRGLRHALVTSEVALALVVLCGAGLMIKSLARLLGVDPGLNPKNVLTMQMSLPQEEIYNGPPGLPRFCQDLDAHVGSILGVISVGAVGDLPFEGNDTRAFAVEGQPSPEPGHLPSAGYGVTCPNYFVTMGIPVLEGREFSHADTLTSPSVIIINETMARRFWPNENPIGRAIRLGDPSGPRLTVIGVVGDVHYLGLDAPVRPQFFRPYTQAGWPVMNVVFRTRTAPANYTVLVKRALAEFSPERPVSGVETMEDIVRDSTGSRRFPMLLLSGFAFFALALAAVGIAGVVSFSVTQHTREIGLRMALGARTTDVLSLMVGRTMRWALVGVGIGITGSMGLTRLLSGVLYDVRPNDPWVLSAVALLLAGIALLAAYLPARRASRIDPMVALRSE
jgi:putative ABC transport system permease protein